MFVFSAHSIGVTKELDGRLLSHRSDYEIHTPDNKDYRVNPKRPQSTAELVSRKKPSLCFCLLQKCCLSIFVLFLFHSLSLGTLLQYNVHVEQNLFFPQFHFTKYDLPMTFPLTFRCHSNYFT